MTESITIILPCAGDGSRLGLKTPKELFEVLPGIAMIDFSLEHIRAFLAERDKPERAPARLRIAVVIRPWKRDVADYVIGQMSGIPVDIVYFDDQYSEWPGSVFSAEAGYSPYNLALMPDSCLSLAEEGAEGVPVVRDKEGVTLIERALTALKTHDVVFGAIPCADSSLLRSLGALHIQNGMVSDFQDKPDKDFGRFNAFWGCYAFRSDKGRELYEFLIRSVRHESVSLSAQSFSPCAAIPVHSYRDLGAWDRIRKFRQDFQGNH